MCLLYFLDAIAPTPVSEWFIVSDLEIAIASPSFASLLIILMKQHCLRFKFSLWSFHWLSVSDLQYFPIDSEWKPFSMLLNITHTVKVQMSVIWEVHLAREMCLMDHFYLKEIFLLRIFGFWIQLLWHSNIKLDNFNHSLYSNLTHHQAVKQSPY